MNTPNSRTAPEILGARTPGGDRCELNPTPTKGIDSLSTLQQSADRFAGVPLPEGAAAGEWLSPADALAHRVLWGATRPIPVQRPSRQGLAAVRVYTHAVQLADGTLSDDESHGAPGVSLDTIHRDDETGTARDSGVDLGPDDARALAETLVQAAEEVDDWTTNLEGKRRPKRSDCVPWCEAGHASDPACWGDEGEAMIALTTEQGYPRDQNPDVTPQFELPHVSVHPYRRESTRRPLVKVHCFLLSDRDADLVVDEDFHLTADEALQLAEALLAAATMIGGNG